MVRKQSSSNAAMVLGRFQPVHLGHIHLFKRALEECRQLIIAVGSSEESRTPENPFTYDERKEMLAQALQAEGIKSFQIVPVPDIGDHARYVSHVKSLLPPFAMVFTNNSFTKELFGDAGIAIEWVDLYQGINATKIREDISRGVYDGTLLHPTTITYLRRIGAEGRLRKILGH